MTKEASILCFDISHNKTRRKEPQANSNDDMSVESDLPKRGYNISPVIFLVLLSLTKDMSEIMLVFDNHDNKDTAQPTQQTKNNHFQYKALVCLTSYILICIAMMLTIFQCQFKAIKKSHNFVPIQYTLIILTLKLSLNLIISNNFMADTDSPQIKDLFQMQQYSALQDLNNRFDTRMHLQNDETQFQSQQMAQTFSLIDQILKQHSENVEIEKAAYIYSFQTSQQSFIFIIIFLCSYGYSLHNKRLGFTIFLFLIQILALLIQIIGIQLIRPPLNDDQKQKNNNQSYQIVDFIVLLIGESFCIIIGKIAIKKARSLEIDEDNNEEIYNNIDQTGRNLLEPSGMQAQQIQLGDIPQQQQAKVESENQSSQVEDKRKKRVKVIMDQVQEAAIFARIKEKRNSDPNTGAPFAIRQVQNQIVDIIQMNKECQNMFTKTFLDTDFINLKVFREIEQSDERDNHHEQISLTDIVLRSLNQNITEYVNYELNLTNYRKQEDYDIPKKRKIGIEVLKTQGQPQDNELMIFLKDQQDMDIGIENDNASSEESNQQNGGNQLMSQIINDMKDQYQQLFNSQNELLRLLEINQKESLMFQLQNLIVQIENNFALKGYDMNQMKEPSANEMKITKQKQNLFRKLSFIQKEATVILTQNILNYNLVNCLFNLKLLQYQEFKKIYSRFDVRLTIRKIISVLKQENSNQQVNRDDLNVNEQYLTMQSRLQSGNFDLIENDRMAKIPSDLQSRMDLLINEIDLNDQDMSLPERIIFDEESLSQILLVLMSKILKIYHRAQLTINVTFDHSTMTLSIKIKEDVATIMPDGSKNNLLGENFQADQQIQNNGLEYQVSKNILKKYGSSLILNQNQIELRIKTLKLDEFQQLPEHMRTTQQLESPHMNFLRQSSFLSRIESAAYFNQIRDGKHQGSLPLNRSSTLMNIPQYKQQPLKNNLVKIGNQISEAKRIKSLASLSNDFEHNYDRNIDVQDAMRIPTSGDLQRITTGQIVDMIKPRTHMKIDHQPIHLKGGITKSQTMGLQSRSHTLYLNDQRDQIEEEKEDFMDSSNMNTESKMKNWASPMQLDNSPQETQRIPTYEEEKDTQARKSDVTLDENQIKINVADKNMEVQLEDKVSNNQHLIGALKSIQSIQDFGIASRLSSNPAFFGGNQIQQKKPNIQDKLISFDK